MSKRYFACALLISIAGCGGDDSGGGGAPLPIDNLGSELARVSCEKIFSCCTTAEVMETFMGITYNDMPITTEAQCNEFYNALLTGLLVAEYKESIAAGRITYDDQAAGDCLAIIDGLTCSQYAGASSGSLDVMCEAFTVGQVGSGGACAENYECMTGYCEGGSENADGVCKDHIAIGQACSGSGGCVEGAYCGFEQSTGMQKCQALKADGATCNLDSECESDNCSDADVCETPAPRCDGM